MSHKLLTAILVTAALATGTNALAWLEPGGERDEAMNLTPDLDNGRDVYEVCAACHLPEGWGTEDGTFPQLAGQQPGVLIKQLADIRALNRNNPTMYPFALPSSIGGPQALADVVAYMGKLPMMLWKGKMPLFQSAAPGRREREALFERAAKAKGARS